MNITTADVQKYTRIVLYWLSGILVSKGFIANDQSAIAGYVGLGVAAVNFAWTIYGNRVVAKINDLMATGQVQAVVTKDKSVSDAVPDPNVTAAVESKVVSK